MDSGSSSFGEKDEKAGSGVGQISGSLKDSKPADIKARGEALGVMAKGVSSLAGSLMKFWVLPKAAKSSVVKFMKDLTNIGGTVANSQVAKTVAESMVLIGEALPQLAKGVMKFGLATKAGLVRMTARGLMTLYSTLVMIGNPATAPMVLVAAAAIGAVGAALQGIGDVFKGLAAVMLSFSGAILLMVGAIALAAGLFKVGPLKAMLIIVGAIGVLGAGFALLGVLSPLILASGAAVAAMGTGLAVISVGLLVFMGSFALMQNVMGMDPGQAIKSIVKPLLLLSLLFAGLGLLSPLILPGAIAAQAMGKGMILLAGGMLALGAVGALLNLIGVDPNKMFGGMALGILKLAGMFTVLGVFSSLILGGALVLVAMTLPLLLFGLGVMGIMAIINKMGGEEGLKGVQKNIALLIGSVLQGVIQGISQGLLGEEGSSKGFFGKAATVAKNVAILIGSIGLLFSVSIALIMFGKALRSFTQAGSIKTVTGYTEKGDPIFGDTVNVVQAGENIAKSIGSFFTTLTETFKDPNILPDKNTIEDMIDILMGNQGFRVLGIRVMGKKRPGLLDAISKFAEIIQTFAKVNQIPYTTEDGTTKFTTPQAVASNMVLTLKSFFDTMSDNMPNLENINVDTVQKMGEILLGQSAAKVLGLKVGRDKHGILEPIMAFADMIDKIGGKPGFITYMDKDGKKQTIESAQAASNIFTSLMSFATTISTSMKDLENEGFKKNKKNALDSIMELTKQVGTISKMQSKIMTSADALNKLSASVQSLADALRDIELEKLQEINKLGMNDRRAARVTDRAGLIGDRAGSLQSSLLSGRAEREGRRTRVEERREEKIAEKESKAAITPPTIQEQKVKEEDYQQMGAVIASAVSTAFGTAQFRFDFATDKSGVLTFET